MFKVVRPDAKQNSILFAQVSSNSTHPRRSRATIPFCSAPFTKIKYFYPCVSRPLSPLKIPVFRPRKRKNRVLGCSSAAPGWLLLFFCEAKTSNPPREATFARLFTVSRQNGSTGGENQIACPTGNSFPSSIQRSTKTGDCRSAAEMWVLASMGGYMGEIADLASSH